MRYFLTQNIRSRAMSRVVDLTSSHSEDEHSGSDSDSTIPYEISSDSDSNADSPNKNGHGVKRSHSSVSKNGESSKHSKKDHLENAASSTGTNSNSGDLGYRLTTVSGLNKSFNDPAMAISLKSLLVGSPKCGKLVCSAQFNYMFDFDWVIDNYPFDAETSPVLVVHGFRGSDEAGLKMTASPYPQISLVQAKLESPYGTHHTKMMLLEHERGLRVVVHTANMIHEDWHQKTQLVWQSPLLPRRQASTPQHSAFLDSLSLYLNAYNLKELREWVDKLQKFDFSLINDDEVAFIASVPGRHMGRFVNNFGHMRLRSCLQKHQVKCPSSTKSSASSDFAPSVRVIAQFSSIGSLGESAEKWVIPELIASCLACFPTSHSGAVLKTTAKPRPILIYPSVADVRGSLEGYAAGGSLPYRKDVASKQKWLTSLLHCWRANITGRTRAMPHVKTYSAVSADFSRVYWLLITSANLSKAAWGKLEKNESQLAILSYEAGVLLMPPRETPNKSEHDQPSWSACDLLLPFDLPPQPYGRGDEPWIADEPHSQKDSRNRTWLV